MMKKYNDPQMKISSFNGENIVTNASMAAIQDWKDGLSDGLDVVTKAVDFGDAVKLVF